MKKIFLSGGMTNLTANEAGEWREELTDILKYDFEIFNPTIMAEDADADDREVWQYDLHNLKESDVVVVNFNDTTSIGTAQEVGLAYSMGIPIIGIVDQYKLKILHPWLKMECSTLFVDNDEDYTEEFNVWNDVGGYLRLYYG